MQVLWRRHPLASDQIAAELVERRGWQLATVKTLLNRLLKKRAIESRRDGKRFLYSPLLRREEWLGAEGDALLARLFGGRLPLLVAHFCNHRKLSASDLEEIEALIRGMKHDR